MLAAGTTLGPYQILAPLGAGGMGEVYRAHDAKLQRDIALKVLPEDLTADETARARLIREARSAAALSHPHICTVYEVGEAGGRVYIAMELVQGQPLSERIGGKPLPVESVIRYGVQIADALAHAHAQHVIHRDVKSGNVMVTAEGRVKVLDFGLAKRVWEWEEGTAPTPQVTLTRTGVVVGTPHYLAPEVLHGGKADAVSDVWALGVVLYEMASGALPFQGATGYELSAAILNETPAPLPGKLMAGLRGVIARCLAKQPGERCQRASEVRAALEALQSEAVSPTGGAPTWIRRGARAAASVVLLAVVVMAAWLGWRRVAPRGPLVERQLTHNPPGLPVRCGALSPNGKYFVYSDSTGLYLTDVASGATRPIPLPPGVRYGYPSSWHSDGTKFLIWAERSPDDTTGGIWEISMLGWSTRQLRDSGFRPTLSPDGSRIAFSPYDPCELWVMGADGEGARRLLRFERSTDGLGQPLWSPDGRRLAYFHGHDTADRTERSIECLDVDSGRKTTLLTDERLWSGEWLGQWGVWTRDGRIVYARADSAISWSLSLWQIKVDARRGERSGQPRRITNWTEAACFPSSVSADGKRLVIFRGRRQLDVYVAAVDVTGIISESPRRLTLNDRNDRTAGWTADGRAAFFFSDREGAPKLFRQRVDQPMAEPLVATPGWSVWDFGGRTSPGGTQVFYWETHAGPIPAPGSRKLMRVPTTGGPPELVLVSKEPAGLRCPTRTDNPCVLAELAGDTVVFSRMGPTGGRAGEMGRIRLREVLADWDWSLSPDGSRIAIVERERIRVLDLRNHEVSTIVLKNAKKVLETGAPDGISWAATGSGFYLTCWKVLFFVDSAGRAREVYRASDVLTPPIASPDGRHIAFSLSNAETNAWLLERF
jgi:hypothetical protein